MTWWNVTLWTNGGGNTEVNEYFIKKASRRYGRRLLKLIARQELLFNYLFTDHFRSIVDHYLVYAGR